MPNRRAGTCIAGYISIILIFIVYGLIYAHPVYAQSNYSQLRLLTAVGDSQIDLPPDQAEIQIGVETEAATATEARQQNAERAQKVVQAVMALGISESSIQTSSFTINPIRRFLTGVSQQGEPPIVAYNVQNTINIKIGSFDLVPKIIDGSVAAGANRVDSINFTLKNDRDARLRALKEASETARGNAEAMASALGVKLVRIQSMQQDGAGVVHSPVLYRSAAPELATPILPGQVTVNASVTLSYVIE